MLIKNILRELKCKMHMIKCMFNALFGFLTLATLYCEKYALQGLLSELQLT